MSWDSKILHRHLTTRRFGRQIRHFDEIDSTNRWMNENWRDFTLNGATVVAEHQTSGRGRFTRRWDDVPGSSLLFSVLLRSKESKTGMGFHQMLPAISLARVLRRRLPRTLNVRLKWPNDVLLNDRKLSGILAERFTVDGQSITIVGMGINVNMRLEQFSEAIRGQATSIFAETGGVWEREPLLADILNEWEPLCDLLREGKRETIRDLWQSLGPEPHSRIVRSEQGRQLAGSYEGIGEDGQLLLRDQTGKLHELYSGDVLHS